MLLRSCQCIAGRQTRHFFTSARNLIKRMEHECERTFRERKKRELLHYATATGVLAVGLAYAAVPLYRVFCQATSYGGTVSKNVSGVDTMQPVKDRTVKIRFNADTAASMMWNFKPQQKEIKIFPGETALAFYTARNPTDRRVIGISTYNVLPFEAGQYFNKIQCFCFEEQQLNPFEEVDMPVFFYIDPEFAEDPKMENVDEITLSYTFFEARQGLILPMPAYIKKQIATRAEEEAAAEAAAAEAAAAEAAESAVVSV